MPLSPRIFQFLEELAANNNKPWFELRKVRYQALRLQLQEFLEELYIALSSVQALPPQQTKKQVFRIYRDMRFRKDAEPYKTHFGAYLELPSGHWYMELRPGASFIGTGIYEPSSSDLEKIRADIDYDAEAWRKLLRAKKLKQYFGKLEGKQLKTAPRAWSKDHEAIELLRYKQFLLQSPCSDELVCSEGFLEYQVEAYKAALPFLARLNQALSFEEEA